MKTIPFWRSASIGFVLLFTGCVIRSVNPWLTTDTQVNQPSPAGFWTDAEASIAAFFTPTEKGFYSVLLQNEKNEASRYTASLHRIDQTLFLMALPPERQDLGVFATIPAHLLFKVEWKDHSFRLFPLNMTDFEARLARHSLKPLEGGNSTDGYILTASSRELTDFIKAELNDPALFAEKPLYTFTRVEK